MHMAFLGNPGTGKTTVARIVGNMYRSLGILSKGHFIEASRTDLIAEYQGQTASKVKRLIQKPKVVYCLLMKHIVLLKTIKVIVMVESV